MFNANRGRRFIIICVAFVAGAAITLAAVGATVPASGRAGTADRGALVGGPGGGSGGGNRLVVEPTPDLVGDAFWRRRCYWNPPKWKRCRPVEQRHDDLATPRARLTPTPEPTATPSPSPTPTPDCVTIVCIVDRIWTAGGYGWELWFMHQVVDCESKWDPYAVGEDGEAGLFQIHPVNWSLFRGRNPWNVYANTEVALALRRKSGWYPWSCAR